MKISIRDFAPIKEADIALDGLTVIAGDNDTGKSTVGKLVYAFLEAAKRQRTRSASVGVHLLDVINNIFGNALRSGDITISHEARSFHFETFVIKKGAVPLLVDAVLDSQLASQIPRDALFIETPLIWQWFDTFQAIAAESMRERTFQEDTPFSVPFSYFEVYYRLNGSQRHNSTAAVAQIEQLTQIKNTVNGKIVFENNSPRFQRGSESFPMPSVATGIQAFGFIQRILELGLAQPGFLLILDEPEVHMHPKWQLEYAKLLVSMVDELGMTVLMTTHSPVFVEAMEFVGKKALGEKCHFYLSERTADGPVVMRDVSDDLEPVYEKLAHPLMQLSLFQGDA